MPPLDKTAWEVLNATADDCENLEQIYRQVCFEPVEARANGGEVAYDYRLVNHAPPLSEVAESIHRLVEQGLLAVVVDEEGRPCGDRADLGYVWRSWFGMTPQGRAAWESSGYLVGQE